MTLTFLILAGQVKVKGQLGEMAKCLEDDDRKIADLARMFFTELATKDNAVYNHFVDMFSLLSAEKNLEEGSLRRIIKFLTGFVEKVSPRTVILLFIPAICRWSLICLGDLGKTCSTIIRQARSSSSSLRNRATMERCGVCFVSSTAQE